MQTARLRQVGDTLMLAIEPRLAEQLALTPNSVVGVDVVRGRLVIEPKPRPRYTLAELLAECDSDAPEADADRAFTTDDNRVGRELT